MHKQIKNLSSDQLFFNIESLIQRINAKSLEKKIISLDISPSKVGIAISDELREIAIPLGSLSIKNRLALKSPRNNCLLTRLRELESQISMWVIGWPLQLNGAHGDRTAETIKILDSLARPLGIRTAPVYFHDERYSSKLARTDLLEFENRQPFNIDIDSLAACRILTEFLGIFSKHC